MKTYHIKMREWGITPHPFHVSCTVTSFQWLQDRQKERVTLQWRNLASTTYATWSNWTPSVTSHVDHVYPRYDTMRNGTLPLCSSCQEPINPSLIVRVKHQIPTVGHSTKYLKSIPENCQGHLNKESLKNGRCLEEPKDTWWVNVIYAIQDGLLGQKKNVRLKTKKVCVKHEPYFLIMQQYLFTGCDKRIIVK